MKKLVLSVLSIAALAISAGSLEAREDYWYTSLSGSYNWNNKASVKETFKGISISKDTLQTKDGVGVAVAVGRSFDQFRLELEVAYRQKSFKCPKGVTNPDQKKLIKDLYTQGPAVMVNLYYDIPVTEEISWYVGGGVGTLFAKTKFKGEAIVDNGNTVSLVEIEEKNTGLFAWQMMTGLSYAISERVELFGGYRLFASQKPKFYKHKESKFHQTNLPVTHSVEAGVRFKF